MPANRFQIGHRVTIDRQGTVFGGQGTLDGVVIWIDSDLIGVDCGPNDDEFWKESHGREGYGVLDKWILETRRPTNASRELAQDLRTRCGL
ncbi:hypothetical protein OG225_41910 (plasmid) [Nocardia sp. NBC_01377]|uniref:hypothetical protein n=1 Tax=Nocardia sp. NBC_01377 TaxID=2903595 RepID=UPI002F9145AA